MKRMRSCEGRTTAARDQTVYDDEVWLYSIIASYEALKRPHHPLLGDEVSVRTAPC